MPTTSVPAAEEGIVGGLLMLNSKDTLRDSVRLLDTLSLDPSDFENPELAGFFSAAELRLREGRPVRPADVAQVLADASGRNQDALERRLVGLRNGANRTEEVFRELADTVRAASMRRRMGEFYKTRARAMGDPLEELRTIEAFAAGLAVKNSGTRLADEDVIAICDQLEATQNGQPPNVVPTGIDALDDVILGFRPTLNVVGGLPSIGKTAFIATVVEGAIVRGQRVGVFALEDGTIGLTRRILSRRSGIPFGEMGARRLHANELEAFQNAAAEWHPLAQRMLKFDGEACSPKRLVDISRDWIVNRGCKLIVIDHLGELEPDETGSRHEDAPWRAMRRMLSELRLIATRYAVPVVACAHFNREAVKAATPTQHHFAESEYIGRMARLALGFWKPDGDEDTSTVRCTVLKNMFGRRGDTLDLRRLISPGMLASDELARHAASTHKHWQGETG